MAATGRRNELEALDREITRLTEASSRGLIRCRPYSTRYERGMLVGEPFCGGPRGTQYLR
jgi:hypothetical protein